MTCGGRNVNRATDRSIGPTSIDSKSVIPYVPQARRRGRDGDRGRCKGGGGDGDDRDDGDDKVDGRR